MSMKAVIKRYLRKFVSKKPAVHVTAKVYQITSGKTLEGKRVIITGGGRGLGYFIAKKCINEGAMVLIVGRDEERLSIMAEKLGEKCKFMPYDVSKADKAETFIKEAVRIFGGGKIDCLVSNAGVSFHEGNYKSVTINGWDQQMDTNLKGAFFLVQAFVEQLQKHDDSSGNVIMITSERGLYCDDIPYGLSKAAINSFTRGLARRLLLRDIRVNAIAPGVTASDMTGYNADGNLYRDSACGKRVFLPEEVAEVTAFLLSDASKCISGEVIACDQGNYLRCDW